MRGRLRHRSCGSADRLYADAQDGCLLVVIEGPDFAGKSTITDQLAEILEAKGIRVRRSTTCLTSGVVSEVVNRVQSRPTLVPMLRSFVFHCAYLFDVLSWRDDPKVVTIQESYWWRVYAFDVVYGQWIGALYLRLLSRWRPRADLAVYLRCGIETRAARARNSGSTDPRDLVRFTSAYCQSRRLEQELFALARKYDYWVVDSEHMPASAAAAAIGSRVLALQTALQ